MNFFGQPNIIGLHFLAIHTGKGQLLGWTEYHKMSLNVHTDWKTGDQKL